MPFYFFEKVEKMAVAAAAAEITNYDGANMPEFISEKKGKEATLTGRTAASLGLFAKKLIEIGKTRGTFTVEGLASEWKMRKRRFYDCTDIFMEMGILKRDWSTRVFTWIGLEGMESACRAVFPRKTDELLQEMFEPNEYSKTATGSKITGASENLLRRVTRFLMHFYMHGYFSPKKHLRRSESPGARIQEYIEKNGLASPLAKHLSGKAGRNAFRRLYDVLNVFDACAFYACADRMLQHFVHSDADLAATALNQMRVTMKFVDKKARPFPKDDAVAPVKPLRRSKRTVRPPSFLTVSNPSAHRYERQQRSFGQGEEAGSTDNRVSRDRDWPASCIQDSENTGDSVVLAEATNPFEYDLEEMFYMSHADSFLYNDATIPF